MASIFETLNFNGKQGHGAPCPYGFALIVRQWDLNLF